MGVSRLRLILLSFLLAFIFISLAAAPAEAYRLKTLNPNYPPNKWVTSSWYNFTWNNNYSSGTYWSGTYWYYSIITIYNYSWGYVNNNSWLYQPGWGTKTYGRSLTESPLGNSWWRVQGYYQYYYTYWSYEFWYWQLVYHWVQRCAWWSWG
ncbi:MAG TPA: hypothetical protein DC017_01785, partial [Candidatus Wallbacteria bacterium]|nr:hypothetical protein [Candidatus Wallbacteria bacterium]